MPLADIQVASTSQTINIYVKSSITGGGLTGLVFNSAGLTAYYALPRAASVAITLVTLAAVTTVWTSGGFKEIDSTNMPGWYRLDIPNAAIASGRFVSLQLQGAANMAEYANDIQLTGWNNQDSVRGGMTALPNAVPGAAGGVFIAGSNAATTVNITGTLSGAVGSVTGNVGGNLLGTLTSAERLAIADAHLTRVMSSVSPQPAINVRCPLNAHRAAVNKVSVAATVMTVYKEDDSTTAWTAALTLNSAAVPITAVDPT